MYGRFLLSFRHQLHRVSLSRILLGFSRGTRADYRDPKALSACCRFTTGAFKLVEMIQSSPIGM